MRLRADQIDLDRFREYVAEAGARIDDAHPEGGEVFRFRIGRATGVVCRNKEGRLTFVSIAGPMAAGMRAGKPASAFQRKGRTT